MDVLKQWAVGLTMASFFGGLVYMLSPRGRMDRAVRCAVSIFILSVFVAPLFGGAVVIPDFEIPESDPTSTLINNETAKLLSSEAETLLADRIDDELESIGVRAKEINVKTDIDESGSIYIEAAEVILTEDTAQNADEIQTRLSTVMGIDVTVKME